MTLPKLSKYSSPSAARPQGIVSTPTMRRSAAIIQYNVGDGGSAYEAMVQDSLASAFNVFSFVLDFRRWRAFKYVAAPVECARAKHFLVNCPAGSVVVKTLSAALINAPRQSRNIVIVHHVGGSHNKLCSWLEPYIVRQLRKADAVVVVSKYWRRFLAEHGVRNIHTVYNAFRLCDFEFEAEELHDFKRRFNLLAKPIVYLGNYGSGKGVTEAFEALRDFDVHLIASGQTPSMHSSMKCYYLERRDYLRLLACSTVAVAMSQEPEGWCRSAHEALLCGTPVLGSGEGGMGELLESGGQTVCPDFRSLRGAVQQLLADDNRRVELARKGYDFARQFTYERFRSEWVALVNQVHTAGSAVPGLAGVVRSTSAS